MPPPVGSRVISRSPAIVAAGEGAKGRHAVACVVPNDAYSDATLSCGATNIALETPEIASLRTTMQDNGQGSHTRTPVGFYFTHGRSTSHKHGTGCTPTRYAQTQGLAAVLGVGGVSKTALSCRSAHAQLPF